MHTIGVVFYIAAMWIAGVMQGLMWRATNADGTLTYTFVESLNATYPYYLVRLGGGLLVLSGMILMAVNVWKTCAAGEVTRCWQRSCRRIPPSRPAPEGRPMSNKHEKIEKNVGLMMVLIAVAVSFGGLAEIVPLMYQAEAIKPLPGVKPYPALQLAGRDIYVREGCYNCHSQMVRTLRFETERYGHYSLAGESVYDRPFQWGSKRTGPDLARVGGRYSDDWHRVHLGNPRDVVPESNMPGFPWLAKTAVDGAVVTRRMRALQALWRPVHGRARSPRPPRPWPASRNWMPWWPTCRGWVATRRGATDHGGGNHHGRAAGAVHRRMDLGLAAVATRGIRRRRAPAAD